MRHGRILLLGLLVALVLLSPRIAGKQGAAGAAICNETGTIAADTHWTNSCVHLVVDGVTISTGVTLTIEPGTIVKLVNPSNLPTITVQGYLTAQGTEKDPVVLTSYKDDAAGGDSNDDGNASAPAPGDWNSIVLEGPGASVTLDHALVRYGGGSGTSGAAITNNFFNSTGDPSVSVSLTHSTVEHSASYGAFIVGGAVIVIDSQIRDNAGPGLRHTGHDEAGGTTTLQGSTFASNHQVGAFLQNVSAFVDGNAFEAN